MCEQPVVSRRGDGGVATDAIRDSGDSEARDDGVTCDEVPLGSALGPSAAAAVLIIHASVVVAYHVNKRSLTSVFRSCSITTLP